METFPHLTVCPYCDSVYRRRELKAGEEARCIRCSNILYRATPINPERWLALTLTAAVAGVTANAYPVIIVGFHGVQNAITLWGAAIALAHGPTFPLAAVIVLLLIVVPFLQIVLLGWLLFFALQGRRAPGFIRCMRIHLSLRPWSMMEVGMLGFLVAGIKLDGFLQVTPGPGCWAMSLLMLLLIVLSRQDMHVLWEYPDYTPPGKGAHRE